MSSLAQIFPKMDLGLEIQKTNIRIRINILEVPSVSILRQNSNFDFFIRNLPKNGFYGWNFKNLTTDSEVAPPRYHMCQFSGKTDNFEFFRPEFGEIVQLRATFWFS